MPDRHSETCEQIGDRNASAALNAPNNSRAAYCGTPLAVADLDEGESVLDLGSGGESDVLVLARRVGPTGKAYGLCRTDEMLDPARTSAAEAQVTNAEFLKGSIEAVPLADDAVDVITSNCVINPSADKPAVLAEAYRALRPGGRLGITDVTAADHLIPEERGGCGDHTDDIAGARTTAEYRAQLIAAGFVDIQITRTHQIADDLQTAAIRAIKPTAPAGVTIRPMRARDAYGVLAVYQAGLDTGDASFETTAPSWVSFDQAKLTPHRYVAADRATGKILGWIAASSVSDRCVYSGVVEHSVYVDPGIQSRGVGTALLNAFIASTETAGIWTIQSGIFPENTGSLRLHERTGFRIVGTRHHLGRHHGRWRDVILLERRSPTAGT